MPLARVVASTSFLLLGLAVSPWPARAQSTMSPPPSVLTLPSKQQAAPAPLPTPPLPAPAGPVRQVAPYSSPRPPAAPAKPYVAAPNAPATSAPTHKLAKPTPVVKAPPHVHAQKPPAGREAAATPAEKAAAKPAPAVAPPPVPAAAVAVPAPPPAAEPAAPAKPAETKGSVTGLPLPRWAALRADEVNLRLGPGMNFPIDWQYHRRDLPVRILREIDVWRLVEDQDGYKGWVHSATLTGRRTFVVTEDEATLRAAASDESAPVARLKPGVIGRIRACDAASAWCEAQVGDYKGWLRRNQFFGADPGEAIGN